MKTYPLHAMLLALLLVVASGTAISKEVDWAALNPEFKGAVFVNDAQICLSCHGDALKHFSKTTHGKTFKYGKSPVGGECESCHGPRSKHIGSPGREYALTSSQRDVVCLQCHEGGNRKYWKNATHLFSGISCTNCHVVMENKSSRNLLAAMREDALCYSCHASVRGEMSKSSHHPVREGKMTCSDCHNPHGSVTASMLKEGSVNDTCYNCHQEKRGPFVWEHPPVRENCLNCHEPHGSNNRKLQNRKDSFLCLQCHAYGGHPNLPRYNRVSNPYGEGCINCHMSVHGSNSPSGPKLVR